MSTEEQRKVFEEVIFYPGLAGGLEVWSEVAEQFYDVGGFEVDAFDLVIRAAAFDGGPVNDGGTAWDGVAHVGLLKDLFEASAGATVSEELAGGEVGIASAIDDLKQAELDGVGDGDFEVQIPRARGGGIFDF